MSQTPIIQCPVCPPEKSDVVYDWKEHHPFMNYVRCECRNCGISGQFRPSREEAIDALNALRTVRPEPTVEVEG